MLTDKAMRNILQAVNSLVITPQEWVRIADEQGMQSAGRLFLYLISGNKSGARLRRSRRVQRKLLEWLNKPEPNPAVLLALSNVRCPEAIPRLIQLLNETNDNIFKCFIANALARQKALDAVSSLVAIAKDPSKPPEVRECCARAAGEIECLHAKQRLLELFHESADWRIRWGIAQGLRRHCPEAAIALLEVLISDPSLPHDLQRVGRRWIKHLQKRLKRLSSH